MLTHHINSIKNFNFLYIYFFKDFAILLISNVWLTRRTNVIKNFKYLTLKFICKYLKIKILMKVVGRIYSYD